MAVKKRKSSKKLSKNKGHDSIIHDPVFTEHLLERLNKTGAIVVDGIGECIYVSEVAQRILKMKKRQILGKQFFDAVPLLTIEGKEINQRKHPVAVALEKNSYVQVTPFFCKIPGQPDSAVLAMNVLQIKKQRSVLGVVVQLRKAERELNIGEMKSLFVSFAAHQLKTPSSIVKGFLELMMREGQKSYNSTQWSYLISAFESNEHLIHVSKTLLGLARLEGGLISPTVKQLDPRRLLQSKIRAMQALLDIKQIAVRFQAEGKGFLHSDEAYFLEIFEILFANAVKHAPNNSTIKVICRTNKDGVEVRVIDSGPGISEAMRTKLFVSAQAEEPHQNSHGLGLYMARKYVALLSGTIGVEARNSARGSDFYFIVPNQLG